MIESKRLGVAVLLISFLGLSACSDSNTGIEVVTPSANVSAADAAGPFTHNTLDFLKERSEPRVAEGATAPSFVVDPTWPKHMPNNWLIGQVGGLSVDSHDNIWVYHRGRSLDESSVRGLGVAGTDADGNPIDAMGNSRVLADQIAGCCSVAPSVLKFDPQGNLLDSWGGPQDPGFLENNLLISFLLVLLPKIC